jgi:hypothetical protein
MAIGDTPVSDKAPWYKKLFGKLVALVKAHPVWAAIILLGAVAVALVF